MNSKLRKRMGEFCERLHPDVIDGFEVGAEWMYKEEVTPRDNLLIEIKNTIDAFSTDTISSLVVTQFHFNKLWELRLKIEELEKGGKG